MSRKFIPTGDRAFAEMAGIFAAIIEKRPEAYHISPDDLAAMREAVDAFEASMARLRGGHVRSGPFVVGKSEARARAAQIIRRIAGYIRINDKVSTADKASLGIHERAKPAKRQPMPLEAPTLRFVRAVHESGGSPIHELQFWAAMTGKARVPGAVRVELFVDLVPVDEPIPAYPGQTMHSQPWYLRSYTKSPIRVMPPMARQAMRVVYWARWADAEGNVGPFSKTAVGWTEGGSHHLMHFLPTHGERPMQIDLEAREQKRLERDESITITLLETQRAYFVSGRMTSREDAQDALPEPVRRDVRQLDAPPPEESAEAA